MFDADHGSQSHAFISDSRESCAFNTGFNIRVSIVLSFHANVDSEAAESVTGSAGKPNATMYLACVVRQLMRWLSSFHNGPNVFGLNTLANG